VQDALRAEGQETTGKADPAVLPREPTKPRPASKQSALEAIAARARHIVLCETEFENRQGQVSATQVRKRQRHQHSIPIGNPEKRQMV
jgi:hypothetical protein